MQSTYLVQKFLSSPNLYTQNPCKKKRQKNLQKKKIIQMHNYHGFIHANFNILSNCSGQNKA